MIRHVLNTLGAVASTTYNALNRAGAASGINITKFGQIVGVDALTGKTPVQGLQDLLDQADAVFADDLSKAIGVEVIKGLIFFASLDPAHRFG